MPPLIRRRTLLLVSGALALTLSVAACGGGDSATAAPEASPADAASVSGVTMSKELNAALPDTVRSSGVLTLATDPTDPPLEFYDDASKLVGVEVDLAAALGKVLGVEVKLVPTKFDTIIPGIQAGRYDGSVSGFADRPDRQKVVDFVDYFTTARGFLVRTGTQTDLETSDDLCGRTVAVAKGTTMAESMAEQSTACTTAGKPAVKSSIFPDIAACVLAVQSNRADVTILPKHAALWTAKQAGDKLEVVGNPTDGKDINGIVLKKDAGLTEPVQKAITQLMASGEFAKIFDKYGLEPVTLKEATVNGGT